LDFPAGGSNIEQSQGFSLHYATNPVNKLLRELNPEHSFNSRKHLTGVSCVKREEGI